MSSNLDGNEQEFVKNGSNNKQKQQKKPCIASVQILFDDGSTELVKVELSQNCSTVAEHAAFLLKNINKSRGYLIGLRLNGPVELMTVFSRNTALIDHNVPLKEDCNYTFRFRPPAQLYFNLESEKARADQAEQTIIELKKKVAVLEEEKHKFEEETKKNMNSFISIDYHIYSRYVQMMNYQQAYLTHHRHLAISDDQRWLYTSSERTPFSQFKLQQNLDGTFGIYSTIKGKFLENSGQNGFGLTEDSTADGAKFEFVHVGRYLANRAVKIRSVGGNGYLRLEQAKAQFDVFHVTIISAFKEATDFELMPAYDLSALLKK